jgi:hypothetical protein
LTLPAELFEVLKLIFNAVSRTTSAQIGLPSHIRHRDYRQPRDPMMAEGESLPRNRWYTDKRTGIRTLHTDNFKVRSDIRDASGNVAYKAGELLTRVSLFQGSAADRR